MVRKTRQKRKAKIKKIPKNSGRDDDGQTIRYDVQSENIQKSADGLESEENAAETAETSDYSTEMTKFSCAVSC